MKTISVEDLKNKMEENSALSLIDVRDSREFEEGEIKPSININIMDPSFASRALDLDPDQTHYVFCRSGGRSASACQFLNKNGFDAVNVEGGIIAWNQL